MPDTAPDAGAVAADPYPNFVEDILPDEETGGETAAATPPAAPDAGTLAPDGSSAQPAAPDASAQPPTPAGSAPSPAAPPVPAAPPASPAPAAAWEFQADRQTIAVPGSKVREDGWLEVPPDQRPFVEQILAEGVAHRGSWRAEQKQYETRIAQLEESIQTNPDILRAKAYNTSLLALLDKGPEAVAAWLDDFKVNFPLLKQQAETAVIQAERDRLLARVSSVDEEAETAELAPKLDGMIEHTITDVIASDPSFAGVDARALSERIRTRFIDQVAYEVEPKARPRGLEAGEVELGRSRDGKYIYVFNAGLVQQEVAYHASLRGGAAAAATAAVNRNKAVTPPAPGAPNGAPPVVPAGNGGPGTPVAKEVPKFASREEMEKWIADGSWKQTFPG